MILLDTNVVSEVMSPKPSDSALEWLNGQPTETLHLSTITIAEIGYGLRSLPAAKRKRTLEDRFPLFVRSGFSHRVSSFHGGAARICGELMRHRRRLGKPMCILDGQIASIARAQRFGAATRNVSDFEFCGLEIVNPFHE